MTDVSVHRISGQTIAELAGPMGSPDAVRQLAAAQRSKHMLLIRQLTESAMTSGHPHADRTRAAYEALAALQEAGGTGQHAVETAVGYPTVAAWSRHTIRQLRREDTIGQASPGRLTAVLAAAALRAGAECSVLIPASDGRAVLPSLGVADLPERGAGDVRCRTSAGSAHFSGAGWSVEIPAAAPVDGRGWQGLRRMQVATAGREFAVALEDLDPFRMRDHPGVSPRLSAAGAQSWHAALAGGWELLASRHQGVADEVATVVKALVPLAAPAQGQTSATSRQTFGSIGLSLPPDASSFGVTLAHETQHAKLYALLDIVDLLEPDAGALYYAPWREDPRPLPGLLHGAYAFLAVTDFWRRQRHAETGAAAELANGEFARWRSAVDLAIDSLLTSGRLTPPGKILVDHMSGALRPWLTEPVPLAATRYAARLSDEHRTRWARNAPGVLVSNAARAGLSRA